MGKLAQGVRQITQIPLGQTKVSRFNVRKDVGDISELVLSVKSVGVLEPIVARPVGKGFEVIIGSRRLAAARKAGMKTIPAIVKELSDDEAVLESLVENLQRGDLTEEEIVEAYKVLHDFDPKQWNQETFGKRMGKSHQWVSRLLAAHEAFLTLQKAGVFKSMSSSPSREERERGVAPTTILTEINEAMRSDLVRESFAPPEIRKKTVELGKTVKELNYEDAVRVVERFKMYPEKPMEKVKEEALAASAGVALKTYLSPKVARQIEEKTGRPIEEGITQVIEKGLESIPTSAGVAKPPMQHWADELTQDPMPIQVANWWKWNRDRLDVHFDFFTTHYSGKDIETFAETLKANGVKALIDVRDTPFSQFRPEFNKDSLAKTLTGKGIKYLHRPELGVPKEQRDKLAKTGNWSALFEWYDKNVASRILEYIDPEEWKSTELAPYAIMCVEKDPQRCHRHRIALALEKNGLKSLDL